MTNLDIGYIGGVIDARGHISIERNTPRVRVTTRRTELLEWLAARTGVGVKLDERGYQRRACSEHCAAKHQHIERQSAYWNVDGARAVIVLWNVLPYLVCQRGEARSSLRHASDLWPVRPRTEITVAMRDLGWRIPKRSDLAL